MGDGEVAGLHHFLLHFGGGGFFAGDVEDADVAEGGVEGGGEDVACGAGDGGDDGAVVSGEGVDEGAFADVGFADEDDGGERVEAVEADGVGEEVVELAEDGGDFVGGAFDGEEGDVGFVGEVDAGFEVGEEMWRLRRRGWRSSCEERAVAEGGGGAELEVRWRR